MPLLVLLPVIIWLFIALAFPEHQLLYSIPVPLVVYLSVALVGLLAVVMRQWSQLYWLALLLSSYWVVNTALQSPLSESHMLALYFFLPLVSTAVAIVMALINKPPLFSLKGMLLLALAGALPPLLMVLPLPSYYQAIDAPSFLLSPVLPTSPLSFMVIAVMALVAVVWLICLLISPRQPARWGQLACWLSIALLIIFMQQSQVAAWVVIAACLSILLALASQMLNLAYIDELTQLPQRRALLAHLRRLGKRSTVVMLDVDHFKKFNDTYGHDVGDQVLRLLGVIFAKESGFKAYRYGGEEFTLVFNHNDQPRIEEALERVRQRVAGYPLRIRSKQRPTSSKQGQSKRGKNGADKVVRVTISLGAAIRRPAEPVHDLLKRADTILYAAKKKGRNCWLVRA
ncbi:hypothetical protein CWE09_09585 [Aliidiomarina minuta]|uniref:diguanylate cyclase n=1 Tax=Aliidiomarina minuta TaxID=880057 RepID=A0A432WA50_9GAMM|nr:GGDEF domain-containing protein [Aliidiomarina minuta]RUO26921.1 hypothetical protein CWE09_09585 [Aliidiomarina minuta]